ncbi:hypothetical protein [Rathayibacter rathayi]|uniref:hypothetical protein n=1 Tax=Rathayibacter rathayi TaxID=33887 RepID=UPI000CE7366C|nr:hypothetical protein [Rathayibacter rathayi]PPH34156.1 hypothetical protein C5C28_10120 [Rathayibacter rathayi]
MTTTASTPFSRVFGGFTAPRRKVTAADIQTTPETDPTDFVVQAAPPADLFPFPLNARMIDGHLVTDHAEFHQEEPTWTAQNDLLRIEAAALKAGLTVDIINTHWLDMYRLDAYVQHQGARTSVATITFTRDGWVVSCKVMTKRPEPHTPSATLKDSTVYFRTLPEGAADDGAPLAAKLVTDLRRAAARRAIGALARLAPSVEA